MLPHASVAASNSNDRRCLRSIDVSIKVCPDDAWAVTIGRLSSGFGEIEELLGRTPACDVS